MSSYAWVCALFLEIFIICYSSSMTKAESRKIGCNLHNCVLTLNDVCSKMKVKTMNATTQDQIILNSMHLLGKSILDTITVQRNRNQSVGNVQFRSELYVRGM